MAKLVFGMNQSLDGYVDHLEMPTGPALFRHWIEQVRALTGSVYGRRMYEVMRYWDEDRPEWVAEEREFLRGKSELHRVDCQVTPGRRKATERATENRPPRAAGRPTRGKGETVG